MPVSRAEFEKIVREMQAKGTPLSMANLMVRTELPRAQIEEWLDEVQRDAKVFPSRDKKKDDAGAKKSKARARDDDDDEDDDEDDKGGGGLSALKNELLGEMVKSKFGIGDVDKAKGSKKEQRAVKTGGVLGAVLPPAGLFYAAPYHIAAIGSVAYLGLAWVSLKLFVYGGLYILILLHLAGAVLGAGYAWRFNRKGKRTVLLPSDAPVRKRKGGRDVEDDE